MSAIIPVVPAELRFWAVTASSLYEAVSPDSEQRASVTKIAIRDGSSSRVRVGEKISARGNYIFWIGDQITAFLPEGGGLSTYQRDIERVNTAYWGGSTSAIAGLFLSKEKALVAFNSKDLEPRDKRFLAETREVLTAIPEGHPYFEVCKKLPFKLA